MKEESLKDYRKTELPAYAVSLFLLLYFTGGVRIPELFTLPGWMSNGFSFTFLGIVFSVFCMILDSMFPRNIKEKICLSICLPGKNIFLSLKQRGDKRISKQSLLLQYKEIFDEIDNLNRIDNNAERKKKKFEYQNTEWYLISRKHCDSRRVSQSHQDYLFCRDLCCLTFSVIVIYLCFIPIGLSSFSCRSLIVLFVIYFLEVIATHVRQNEFVKAVIIEDIICEKIGTES